MCLLFRTRSSDGGSTVLLIVSTDNLRTNYILRFDKVVLMAPDMP